MNQAKIFSMPLWGPYSKKYMGITRIIDKKPETGARFDVSVHPTIWNSNCPVPNVTTPSGYHPWRCAKDYSFYSCRHELMWKDQVTADVSYSKLGEESYLIRCEMQNNTSLAQSLVLNVFAAMELPEAVHTEAVLPEKCDFINAVDYTAYAYAVTRPWDEQNPDGMEKGVFLDGAFTGRKGLGDRIDNKHVHFLHLKPFGCEKGDKVTYRLHLQHTYAHPVVTVRYKSVTHESSLFTYGEKEIAFPAVNGFGTVSFDLADTNTLTLTACGTGGVELDFLAVTEAEDAQTVHAETIAYHVKPQVETTEVPGGGRKIALSYPEFDSTFYIMTFDKRTRQRHIDSGCLEDALVNRLSNGDPTYDDLQETFSGSFKRKKSDEGYFHNTLIHSIFIEPGETQVQYIVVSKGECEAKTAAEYERIYRAAEQNAEKTEFNESGRPYELSVGLLKAALLTNVVYPIYKHGENVIHHCPGKRWDCLYTWDSGFIALGLLECSKALCEYILNMYLSTADNPDYAFLHHGSPVPVQFYQYLELLQRTNDKAHLLGYYDRAMLYYRFLTGKTHGSTTTKFHNGLTTTYDYFYSTSGMDDYPAQVAMIAKKDEKHTCPVLSTAQAIRVGKIMRMIANVLGKTDDAREISQDIEWFTKSLNEKAWDEKSGYFAYTVYDDENNLQGFLETPEGENLSKGMDGIYPLIAGAVTGQRREKLIAHLKNPKEMWSRAGISAVDQSASYYMDNGYWNGNVWMSHQWFIWKTMLDLGDTDFAFAIADRALNIWKAETDFSYCTYECFNIATGRGGWFHNFGGLSAPVLVWADAYYKPGTLSAGFETWIDRQCINDACNEAEIDFTYCGENDGYALLLTLSDKYEYTATLNDEPLAFTCRRPGALEFKLDKAVRGGKIKVVANRKEA